MKENIFMKSFLKENPILVLFVGLSVTLGITTSLTNGFGMGMIVLMILIICNIIMSLIQKAIPENLVIPTSFLIVATITTIARMLLQAYAPALDVSLHIYVPILIADYVLVQRATKAAQSNIGKALIDGFGMGLSFMLTLLIISGFRELLATGMFAFNSPLDGSSIFAIRIIPEDFVISLFNQPFGAFITIALFAAIVSAIVNKKKVKEVK